MRNSAVFLAIALTFFASTSLRAESPFVRELAQLQQQRDRDLAAAEAPIRLTYRQSLEALVRRATQANDLEAATILRSELQKLGGPEPLGLGQPTQPVSGAEALASRLSGTKWVWFGGETLTFLPDGKSTWSTGNQTWPWKVVSVGLREIEGVNMARGEKFTIAFEHDLKTGTIKGSGPVRKTHIIAGP